MKKALNSNTLKLIAIIAMTVDHIAWLVFPGYNNGILPVLLHIVGRLTCPIMCYFIAEGYHRTKNINKYTLRLFLFSFISHFAYIFASSSFVDWKSFIPFYYGEFFQSDKCYVASRVGLGNATYCKQRKNKAKRKSYSHSADLSYHLPE